MGCVGLALNIISATLLHEHHGHDHGGHGHGHEQAQGHEHAENHEHDHEHDHDHSHVNIEAGGQPRESSGDYDQDEIPLTVSCYQFVRPRLPLLK